MKEPKKAPLLKGRKPAEGVRRQFLTATDPEVIKAIKTAAIGLDTTASELMEGAPPKSGWPGATRSRRDQVRDAGFGLPSTAEFVRLYGETISK